ncbi:MAG: glycine cleavage system protein H [candidate division WOR-3 bacterium]
MKKDIKAIKTDEGGENPCIWMKAGVIAYRMCTTNYDCKNCEFDQALVDSSGKYVESPLITEAIKKLRELPGPERKCRYMLTNDLAYKICSNNYECWHCAVDQYIQDLIDTNPLLRKKRERAQMREKKVKGFAFREDYYYTPRHLWLKVEGENVRVGIDDFAARIIGRVERVDFIQGKSSIGVNLGSGRRIVSMELPFTSKIIETNEALKTNPGLLSTDPFNRGWLVKIQAPKELSADIMKGTEVREWLEKEFNRLHEEIEEDIGVAITDGGEIVSDLYNRLTDEQWQRLVDKFLK